MTKELTLEKFEEASERVKEVTSDTRLVYSEYYSNQTGNKVYLKPEDRAAYYVVTSGDSEYAGRIDL